MKMKLQANVLSTEFKEHKSKEKKKIAAAGKWSLKKGNTMIVQLGRRFKRDGEKLVTQGSSWTWR